MSAVPRLINVDVTRTTSVRTADSSLLEELSLSDLSDRPWTKKDHSVLKYVDDFLACEKVRISTGISHWTKSKTTTKIHAPMSQEFFQTVGDFLIPLRTRQLNLRWLLLGLVIPSPKS